MCVYLYIYIYPYDVSNYDRGIIQSNCDPRKTMYIWGFFDQWARFRTWGIYLYSDLIFSHIHVYIYICQTTTTYIYICQTATAIYTYVKLRPCNIYLPNCDHLYIYVKLRPAVYFCQTATSYIYTSQTVTSYIYSTGQCICQTVTSYISLLHTCYMSNCYRFKLRHTGKTATMKQWWAKVN